MESFDTPLKMLGHTEGHDMFPCLYTLFGPKCSMQLTNCELIEDNDKVFTGTSFDDALQPPLVTESGGVGNFSIELPWLVYVSHEKRLGFQHHKKAGVMNALVIPSYVHNSLFLLISSYEIH